MHAPVALRHLLPCSLSGSTELCQDENSEWQALPYEIASAFVRTLAIHMHQLQVAKDSYIQLRASDENETAAHTIKARTAYESLKNHSRYMVMNSRTGHVATQDWVSRMVTRSADGIPIWKNKSAKKSAPWTMMFTFRTIGKDPEVFLNLASAAPQRRVRCWDLRGGNERCKIASVLVGYEHMLNDFEQDEEAGASDAESSVTCVGDEAGLEGPVFVLQYDPWGPFPKTAFVSISSNLMKSNVSSCHHIRTRAGFGREQDA